MKDPISMLVKIRTLVSFFDDSILDGFVGIKSKDTKQDLTYVIKHLKFGPSISIIITEVLSHLSRLAFFSHIYIHPRKKPIVRVENPTRESRFCFW